MHKQEVGKDLSRILCSYELSCPEGAFLFSPEVLENSQIIQTTQVQSTSVMDNTAGYWGCWHFSHLHWIPVSVFKDYWEAAMHFIPPTQPHLSLSCRPKWIESCAGTAVLRFVWNSSTNNNYMESTTLQEQEWGSELVCDPSVPTNVWVENSESLLKIQSEWHLSKVYLLYLLTLGLGFRLHASFFIVRQ